MTKKDYIIIAKAFNTAIDALCQSDELNPVENMPTDKAMYLALIRVIEHISRAMQEDNPNFNRFKFLKAIKVQDLK